jgi:hypothetical protein
MRRFVLLVAFGLLLTRSAMADGSIVSWGDDFYDLVSDTPTGTGFQAIAAGYSNSIALKGPTGPNPCGLRCSTDPNHRRNGFAAMPVESNETNKE